eukprot:scaffold13791_cov168-Skeletonema_dohrnii-CCMP3373.AAC.3
MLPTRLIYSFPVMSMSLVLWSYTPAESIHCNAYKACRETIRIAREIYPDLDKEGGRGLALANSTPIVPTATAYVAFLYRNGLAEHLYHFSNTLRHGSKKLFVRAAKDKNTDALVSLKGKPPRDPPPPPSPSPPTTDKCASSGEVCKGKGSLPCSAYLPVDLKRNVLMRLGMVVEAQECFVSQSQKHIMPSLVAHLKKISQHQSNLHQARTTWITTNYLMIS